VRMNIMCSSDKVRWTVLYFDSPQICTCNFSTSLFYPIVFDVRTRETSPPRQRLSVAYSPWAPFERIDQGRFSELTSVTLVGRRLSFFEE
jgi:hypothetical protein